ncbi:DNA methyltransferase [Archangium lansingense]|uniref:TRM11 family SAM-dependent methyltransferase n=1 Tax=Archangium lansingense TaxID=2995310 RepID=UPI003B7C598A
MLGESWEYADADTRHLTHNIHRYSGKFIPQIAARAISLLTQPGERVVDPYCGSGTTLLESALLGRRATGVDLNPLAVLIARTKTTRIPKAKLEGLVRTLHKALTAASASKVEKDPRFTHDWYRKWFQPHVLRELLEIDLAIREVDDEALRDVARVAFSDILRRNSNAHSGYPNVMFDKNAPEKDSPIQPFLKALERIADMVASLSTVSASWSDVEVVHGSATALPMGEATVDAVVSHPPYIGSIPYAEYGALSLQWLGSDSRQLDRELTGGRRQSAYVVQRFEDGYGQMLKEAARVLKPGRHAFLMVGNPVVRGEVVDLAEMTLRLARDAGLDLVVRTDRQGVNRRANKMGAEHLLFFRKASEKRAEP